MLPGMETDDPRPRTLRHAMLNDLDLLRELRQTGPVHEVDLAGTPIWLVTGHEAITTAFADATLTAGADPEAPDIAGLPFEEDLSALPPEDHARLRRMIGRQLTARRVAALRPLIQRETDRLLDAIPAGETADFVDAFARRLPVAVLCDLFALPEDGRRLVHDYVLGWLVEDGDPAGPAHDATGIAAMAAYLRDLIARRRAHPGDDLISAMIVADGDPAGDLELLSAVRLILVAGHRAVTTLLANGLATLTGQPELWRQLVAEPAVLPRAVEELLRIVTPVPLSVPRFAAADTDLAGVPVCQGAAVQAAWGAANRDPARFTDPDTIDLCRSDNPHLSFGHGHHYCLGAALGRAEAQITFGTLARRFPRLLAAGRSTEADYRPGTVRELLTLPIVLDPDAAGQRSV
jgi:cytochrome P450